MSTSLTPSSTERQNRLTAFLAALAFFLSTIEFLLPRPLPFLRVGLANIPLLLALQILDFRHFVLLMLVKVLGMNLLSGGLFSYIALFSLLGTLASGLLMRGLYRFGGRCLSFAGLSTAGALASNGMQLLAARYIVFGEAAFYMLPMVAGFGLASGLALGIFTNRFAAGSNWLASVQPGAEGNMVEATGGPEAATVGGNRAGKQAADKAAGPAATASSRKQITPTRAALAAARRRERFQGRVAALPAAVVGVGLILLVLLLPGLPAKLALFTVGLLLSWLAGRRTRLLMVLPVMSGIVLAHLFIPSGRVLWSLGPLIIGEDALLQGLQKALVFESIILFSKAAIRPDLRLPGKTGRFFAAAMYQYEQLLAAAGNIRPRHFFADVDDMLKRLWGSDPAGRPPGV